jgi:probable F420-dependent oxidoreductase
MKRPFRFGCGLFGYTTRETLVEGARKAESTGYSIGLIPDHYSAMFSPLVALQCIADCTSKLRLGTYVIANDYRHPAELAKQFATLDVLSAGRVEVGIGSGYAKPEYDALGLQYDAAGVRVERLGEAVQIIRRLLDGEKLTFEGKHYKITDYENFPKPVQQRVPIMVGGGGRRVLSMAAQHADIVGFAASGAGFGGDPFKSGTWEATAEKVGWVRAAAGGRFDSIELNSYSSIWVQKITDNARGEAEKRIEEVRKRLPDSSITVDELLESPHAFVGTVDAIVEKFHRMRDELGISYFMMFDPESLAPVVERLAPAQ